jgi:hypothetical protein
MKASSGSGECPRRKSIENQITPIAASPQSE